MSRLDLLLYPELRALAGREREDALAQARATPFDLVELAGMAAAVVLVTAATSYGPHHGFLGQLSMALANFLVAIPLLALSVGPFFYRRTRRGLRKVVGERFVHVRET